MAWLRILLSEDEQATVRELKEQHPEPLVRRRLLVVWSLHGGLTREQAAQVAGVDRSTVQRFVAMYRDGGLEALLQEPGYVGRGSDLARHTDVIRQSFEKQPVRSMAEACHRIEALTGIKRSPTQVRKFLTGMGLKWQRVRAIPVPPKKVSTSM